MKRTLFLTIIISYFLFLNGCGSSLSSQINYYASSTPEESACTETINYSNGVLVVGTAKFEKRSVEIITETTESVEAIPRPIIKLKGMFLSDPLPEALPIKFAEVSILNEKNQRIQCGMTDGSGFIKAVDQTTALKIPAEAGEYKVRVLSRSLRGYNNNTNDFAFISIKQDKYKNKIHEISQKVRVTSNATISVNLVAKARQIDSENVEAGAFNILNSLLLSYDYIKANTLALDTKCLSNKLDVYWKAGFNPIQYSNPEADPQTLPNTSYYLQSTKELYISGGQLGDMSLSNTDHFDDFAILHEFGHFIEDYCGAWTSPGGNHAFLSRVDPRLAWSEGWANFFAAHIVKNNLSLLDSNLASKLNALTSSPGTYDTTSGWTYFFNSTGFYDSLQNIANGEGWFIDFKKPGKDPGAFTFAPYSGQEFDKVNPIQYPAEGHFREGAISRGLFKVANSCAGNQCATTSISFENMWKSFDRQNGLGLNQSSFVSSDQYFDYLNSFVGPFSPNHLSILESEALHLKGHTKINETQQYWPGFARALRIGGPACSLKIQPKSDGALNNSTSDQRYSNHFYAIDFNRLNGLQYINVTLTKVSGTSVDHDLILFKNNYFFNDDNLCVIGNDNTCTSVTPQRTSSNDVIVMNREPAATLSTTYSKVLSFETVPTNQSYLLDLRTYTAGLNVASSTEYTYRFDSNLGALCPE